MVESNWWQEKRITLLSGTLTSMKCVALILKHCLQVHFGVNSGATRFAIEHQAVNEATFRCPDEMGWKPQV